MKASLRHKCRSGEWRAGAMVAPLRQLASEFGVSKEAATQVLRELASEGLLSVVPNVGTFVGHVPSSEREFYLFLLPDEELLSSPEDRRRMQIGFEARIAQLGGASLSLKCSIAQEARDSAALPRIAGLFNVTYGQDLSLWPHLPGASEVRFGNDNSHIPPIHRETDTVNCDNEDGAYIATRHLIETGHRRVAYLSVCPPGMDIEKCAFFAWSAAREAGWKRALEEAGLGADLCFGPDQEPPPNWSEVGKAMAVVARAMLAQTKVEAVVAANDFVAHLLLEALEELQVPPLQWPALVGFDNLPHHGGHVMSSMEASAERTGAVAADLLWERRHGQLGPARVARYVPMRLVARLTSQPRWSASTFASDLFSPSGLNSVALPTGV